MHHFWSPSHKPLSEFPLCIFITLCDHNVLKIAIDKSLFSALRRFQLALSAFKIFHLSVILFPHTTPTQFVYFRNLFFNNILLHPLNLSISFNNETFYYDCKATATLSSVHFVCQFQTLFNGAETFWLRRCR